MGDSVKCFTRAAVSARAESTLKSGKGASKAKDEENEFQKFVRNSLLDDKSAPENKV